MIRIRVLSIASNIAYLKLIIADATYIQVHVCFISDEADNDNQSSTGP